MDVKYIPKKLASSLEKDELGKTKDPKIDNKRKSEDVFEPNSEQPPKKRLPPVLSISEQSLLTQKFSRTNDSQRTLRSATVLRTLERRFAQLLEHEKGESKAASDLAELAHCARKRGLPLVFTFEADPHTTIKEDTALFPFSYEHFEASGIESAIESLNPVYVFLPVEGKVHYLGSSQDFFTRKHPMLGYVSTFNDLIKTSGTAEKGGLLDEAAMGFVAFQHGVIVKRNIEVANNFLRLIPPSERKETFGKLLVESLRQEQYPMALLCLPYSKGISSYDEEGYSALVTSLHPEAEEVLRKLVAGTKEQDLQRLAEMKKYALFAKYPRAAQILEDHARTLGYILDKK